MIIIIIIIGNITNEQEKKKESQSIFKIKSEREFSQKWKSQ